MRAPSSRVITPALGLASLLVAFAACSDDPATPRLPFDADDASSPVDAAGVEKDAGSIDAASPADSGGEAAVVREPFDPSPAKIVCGEGACAKRIVAGVGHYCAVLSDNSLRCWGKARALAPSVDAAEPAAGPRTVAGIPSVVDVAAGGDGTCAVVADGTVLCWDTTKQTPTPVAGITGADRIWVSSNGYDLCARVGTDLMCWSPSWRYGGGIVTKMDLGGTKVADAALSSYARFVVDDKQAVFSSGTDTVILGRPASSVQGSAALVDDLPPVLSIAVSSHACAIAVDGRLFCWGSGAYGQLGLGYNRNEMRPQEVTYAWVAWPQQLAAASDHTCMRTTDSALWCWGAANERGQLGYADSFGVYVPTRVTSLDPTSTAAVATGSASTCAIATDGSVRCWGDNRDGQLGLGAVDSLRHPTPAVVSLD